MYSIFKTYLSVTYAYIVRLWQYVLLLSDAPDTSVGVENTAAEIEVGGGGGYIILPVWCDLTRSGNILFFVG